jgi:hypothetical protein
MNDCPKGHMDYDLFKRLDDNQPKRLCKPIQFELLDGSVEDAEYICDQLDEGFNKEHLEIKHDWNASQTILKYIQEHVCKEFCILPA